jgi:single-stranded-DNA-specific exonuclease
MKVKQLVPQLNKNTFADDYFRACGIDDVDEFKEPVGKYVGDVREYSAIQRKVELFKEKLNEIVKNNKRVVIIQDSDSDGICSATLTYNILRWYGIKHHNIITFFHSDKTHGLTDEIVEQIVAQNDISMVIVPDAGSNDIKQIQQLINKDTMVVVLDHHEVDKSNLGKLDSLQRQPNFIIVNNQLERRTNKDLCGTGVVFKFWQSLCMSFDDIEYSYYLDLVALANIADVMDMRNLENIVFNKWGLWKGVTNPFLRALCEKYCKKTNGITPEDIAWNIAPKLNAVCRSSEQETKAMVFEAFCEMREDYEEVIKTIERCYRYQRETCKKMYEKLISEQHPQDNYGKVVIKFCDNTPYTGLVANKLMEYYNKPVLLVHEDEGRCTGSCRSPVPIREQVAAFPDIVFAQGHEHAFGVCWKRNDTGALVDYLEQLDLNICVEQVVASTLNPSNIPTWLFGVTEQYARCWGTGVKAPQFYIPRIRISSKDIRELGNGTTLKFKYKDVEYVKFFASHNDKEALAIGKNKPLIIDLIGSLGVNEYRGNTTLQVKIDKFEILEERWEDIW